MGAGNLETQYFASFLEPPLFTTQELSVDSIQRGEEQDATEGEYSSPQESVQNIKVNNITIQLQQVGMECDFCCAEFEGMLDPPKAGVYVIGFSHVDHWLCRSRRGIERCKMQCGGWYVEPTSDTRCHVSLVAAVEPSPRSGVPGFHSALASTLAELVKSLYNDTLARIEQGLLEIEPPKLL